MVSFHVYSHIFSLLILADLFLHSQLKNYRTFFLTFLNGYISFSKIQKSVFSCEIIHTFPFETRTCYTDQGGLEHLVIHRPVEYWD